MAVQRKGTGRSLQLLQALLWHFQLFSITTDQSFPSAEVRYLFLHTAPSSGVCNSLQSQWELTLCCELRCEYNELQKYLYIAVCFYRFVLPFLSRYQEFLFFFSNFIVSVYFCLLSSHIVLDSVLRQVIGITESGMTNSVCRN